MLRTVSKKRSSTMSKRKRTEKSKYKHQSTGDHCTCAAYVAEIMCMKYAEYKNVGSLPFKFWSVKPWDWTFKKQLWAAREVIKNYGEEAVVRAVNSPEWGKIFSLKNKRAIPIIKKYSEIVKKEKEQEAQQLDVKEDAETRKKSFGKKSKLNKLRGLKFDGKED
jgi:hypothetical protein